MAGDDDPNGSLASVVGAPNRSAAAAAPDASLLDAEESKVSCGGGGAKASAPGMPKLSFAGEPPKRSAAEEAVESMLPSSATPPP